MNMFKRNRNKFLGTEFLRMCLYYEQKYEHDHGVYQLFVNEWRYTK